MVDKSLYDSIEFRPFASLTSEEKSILLGLTFKREGKRSLFQQWLKHYSPKGIYAALVYDNDKIIAWAAVNTHYGGGGKKIGIVGVFVSPEKRGRGIAHQALDTLLSNLLKVEDDHDHPEYLGYNEGMEALFQPVIEHYGFKVEN